MADHPSPLEGREGGRGNVGCLPKVPMPTHGFAESGDNCYMPGLGSKLGKRGYRGFAAENRIIMISSSELSTEIAARSFSLYAPRGNPSGLFSSISFFLLFFSCFFLSLSQNFPSHEETQSRKLPPSNQPGTPTAESYCCLSAIRHGRQGGREPRPTLPQSLF